MRSSTNSVENTSGSKTAEAILNIVTEEGSGERALTVENCLGNTASSSESTAFNLDRAKPTLVSDELNGETGLTEGEYLFIYVS